MKGILITASTLWYHFNTMQWVNLKCPPLGSHDLCAPGKTPPPSRIPDISWPCSNCWELLNTVCWWSVSVCPCDPVVIDSRLWTFPLCKQAHTQDKIQKSPGTVWMLNFSEGLCHGLGYYWKMKPLGGKGNSKEATSLEACPWERYRGPSPRHLPISFFATWLPWTRQAFHVIHQSYWISCQYGLSCTTPLQKQWFYFQNRVQSLIHSKGVNVKALAYTFYI